ncbi:hypothetical protein EVAR_97496_1 [Eumeta japonica]|uniref:Uncharacterized protein n=1 Tax=Eumeta variegata TaxID=151549 RepID=A0A4C1T0J0_EUMVA|nr:hypothetical protein EVAR_97496_1 [Eumeta japonica]
MFLKLAICNENIKKRLWKLNSLEVVFPSQQDDKNTDIQLAFGDVTSSRDAACPAPLNLDVDVMFSLTIYAERRDTVLRVTLSPAVSAIRLFIRYKSWRISTIIRERDLAAGVGPSAATVAGRRHGGRGGGTLTMDG